MKVDVYSAAHVLLGSSANFQMPDDDWVTQFAKLGWLQNSLSATNYRILRLRALETVGRDHATLHNTVAGVSSIVRE